MKNQVYTREVLETKVNAEIQRVIDEVSNEYHQFKEKMLNSTPEEVFNNSYKINAYNDFDMYFEDDGFENMINYYIENENDIKLLNIYNGLIGMNYEILYNLYEFLFNYEGMSTTTWENIDDIIKDCYFVDID